MWLQHRYKFIYDELSDSFFVESSCNKQVIFKTSDISPVIKLHTQVQMCYLYNWLGATNFAGFTPTLSGVLMNIPGMLCQVGNQHHLDIFEIIIIQQVIKVISCMCWLWSVALCFCGSPAKGASWMRQSMAVRHKSTDLLAASEIRGHRRRIANMD